MGWVGLLIVGYGTPMTTESRPAEPHRDPQLTTPTERAYDATGASDSDPARRDLRADIGKYVSLADFPVTAESLIDTATANGAPDFVVRSLRDLPTDAPFETARDLWIALDLEATERF
jgi:hypothetical protein